MGRPGEAYIGRIKQLAVLRFLIEDSISHGYLGIFPCLISQGYPGGQIGSFDDG